MDVAPTEVEVHLFEHYRQHVAPRFSRFYIQEFIRVLAPGGVALFQLPAISDAR